MTGLETLKYTHATLAFFYYSQMMVSDPNPNIQYKHKLLQLNSQFFGSPTRVGSRKVTALSDIQIPQEKSHLLIIQKGDVMDASSLSNSNVFLVNGSPVDMVLQPSEEKSLQTSLVWSRRDQQLFILKEPRMC